MPFLPFFCLFCLSQYWLWDPGRSSPLSPYDWCRKWVWSTSQSENIDTQLSVFQRSLPFWSTFDCPHSSSLCFSCFETLSLCLLTVKTSQNPFRMTFPQKLDERVVCRHFQQKRDQRGAPWHFPHSKDFVLLPVSGHDLSKRDWRDKWPFRYWDCCTSLMREKSLAVQSFLVSTFHIRIFERLQHQILWRVSNCRIW